ncbi:MAG: hypothetical protein OZ919_08655 [Xanthomonadaceae bacterium]|nr:hypothetical protein [Xanthomonadaceae bacterium]
MKTLKPARTTVLFLCLSALLTGCTRLMMCDFHKGTEVARIDIGRVHTITRSIDLPAGKTDMSFVVRDYDCKQPLNASITLEIQLANGTIMQRDVNLDELTWPVSGGDCRPIGYLRLADPNYTRPLRITIDRKSNPVRLSISVMQAADASRQMSIWVVYNDRNPVDQMLETHP